ncbi:MAG: hypothetical protein WCX28_09500 [Bacteriovoracaceae bacterium]
MSKFRNDEAMKLLEEGIPEFPNYYAAYIVLGKTHLAFNEYSHAFTAFSKALELSPFNQTAAQLLTTVPNKPDESTRTTDATYFTVPGATPQQVHYEIPAVQPPAATEPVHEIQQPETFEKSGVEEMSFTQATPEPYEPDVDEPVAQTMYAEPEQQVFQQSDEPFPTYDEYFAQNQHRINTETPIRLDDYLSGDYQTPAPTEEIKPQHEFVNDAYIEPEVTIAISEQTVDSLATPEVESHFEPEPVFSSPEQAQLFAEMTGIDEPSPSSSTTDLDSLTEKLQSAEKIVPEINYQPKTSVPQETHDEQVYETDAVTPTLAEIYASQGEYRAAIQAYEILMFSQPAKGGEFQQRIRDLQQKQMEKDGLI